MSQNPTRKQIKPVDLTLTRLDIEHNGRRLSITGPALAVIALVALVGMIWVSMKVVDLSERIMLEPNARIVRPLESATTKIEAEPGREASSR